MRGLLYCHAPIGYAISLVIGGLFFAEKMRTTNAVTMLDPFQAHYGRWMGLLLCLPAVCGELLWTAAMFCALGYTADVIMGIDASLVIIVASTGIFAYTALGGYYSVTYTDALQIGSTAACLWSCVPFVVMNAGVGAVGPPQNDWVGSVALWDIGQDFDIFLMTSLGGIPWQVYFQRVLGCEGDFSAKMLSFVAAVGSVAMAVPAAVIGAAAKTTNLTALGYVGPWPLKDGDGARVLPLAIQYLTPGALSTVGMIGVTAAVMSSVDSSMLSASAMITKNIYHAIYRPHAGEPEVALMLRVLVCIVGAGATFLALSVRSVFDLWTLCSDLVYVLLFPQLVALFYIKHTNAYGSFIGELRANDFVGITEHVIAWKGDEDLEDKLDRKALALKSFVVGGLSRWLCGVPSLNVPVSLRLPAYDQQRGQRFPLRLGCMALGLATLVLVSLLSATAFEKGWLPLSLDLFGCFQTASTDSDMAEWPDQAEAHAIDATSHSKAGERKRRASADAHMSSAESKSQHSLRSSTIGGTSLTEGTSKRKSGTSVRKPSSERQHRQGLGPPSSEKKADHLRSSRRGSSVARADEPERLRRPDLYVGNYRVGLDPWRLLKATVDIRRTPSGVGILPRSLPSASSDRVKGKAKEGSDASRLRANTEVGKTTLDLATHTAAVDKAPSSEKRKPKTAGGESTRSVRGSRTGAKGSKLTTHSPRKSW
ncbi:high-affinity choline transporter 1-like [Haemaphysalis longicornis]